MFRRLAFCEVVCTSCHCFWFSAGFKGVEISELFEYESRRNCLSYCGLGVVCSASCLSVAVARVLSVVIASCMSVTASASSHVSCFPPLPYALLVSALTHREFIVLRPGYHELPIGSKVVPFWGSYLGSYKALPKKELLLEPMV